MTAATPLVARVACLGNRAAGDDAFGPLVADALRAAANPVVDVVDLGCNPMALLDRLTDQVPLYLVDAAQSGDAPAGRLLIVDWFGPARPGLIRERIVSSHGVSAADVMALADRLGRLPRRVRLVAMTLTRAMVGQPASHWLARRVADAADAIAQDIDAACRPDPEPKSA